MEPARKLASYDDILALLDAGAWREAGRLSDGDVTRIPPFEGIELDVGRLFPPEA